MGECHDILETVSFVGLLSNYLLAVVLYTKPGLKLGRLRKLVNMKNVRLMSKYLAIKPNEVRNSFSVAVAAKAAVRTLFCLELRAMGNGKVVECDIWLVSYCWSLMENQVWQCGGNLEKVRMIYFMKRFTAKENAAR